MTDARRAEAPVPELLSWLLFGGALLAVYGASFFVVHSPAFPRASLPISLGVTTDLTVTASAVAYLLLVRRGHLPASALWGLVFIGISTAHFLLPGGPRVLPHLLTGIGAAVEVALLVQVLRRAREVRRRVALLRGEGHGPIGALTLALLPVLRSPRLASVLGGELAVLGLALFGVFRRPLPDRPGRRHSYHRKSQWGAILGVFLFVLLVEGGIMHVVVMRLSPTLAWVLSASTVYFAILLVGDYHAVRLSAIHLCRDELRLEFGARWRLSLSYADIAAMRPGPGDQGRLAVNLSLYGTPQITLDLRREIVLEGIYGLRKKARQITLGVDDPEPFVSALLQKIVR